MFNMSLLNVHDFIRINYLFYFDNFHFFNTNKWFRPILIEDHSYGSDPITHKKIREKTPNPPENTSTSESNSSTNPSTSVKTQTDKTDLSKEQSKSSIKRQKLN